MPAAKTMVKVARLIPLLTAVFAVLGLGVWWSYSSAADRVLWTVSVGILVVLAANGLMLAVAAARIRALRFAGPISAEVGFKTSAPIHWPAWLEGQPFVRIGVEWVMPAAEAEIVDGTEWVQFSRRMKGHHVRRRIRLQDWTGVWSWEFETESKVEVTVQPALFPPAGPPPRLHHVNGEGDASEGSGEGDLLEFRSYQAGDAANRILWKIFSRTGNLFVRRPEKAGSPLVGIFLVCSGNDGPAAELAWYLTNKNNPLSQEFFGDNWVFGTSFDFSQSAATEFVSHSSEAALDRIMASGGAVGAPDSSALTGALESFIRHAGAGLSTVAVLTAEKLEGVVDSGMNVCQVYRISRKAGGEILEWEPV